MTTSPSRFPLAFIVARAAAVSESFAETDAAAFVLFRSLRSPSSAISSSRSRSSTLDFDGDGDLDLVVTIFGRQAREPCVHPGVRVLLGDGEGYFEMGPFTAFEDRRPRWVEAADFDLDGREDLAVALDDFEHRIDEVAAISNGTRSPNDNNGNGLPDICEFVRGDVDGDGAVRLTDAIRLLDFLFRGGDRPGCLEACDADDDGELNLSDAVRTLIFLFGGGSPLAPPAGSAAGECAPESSWIDRSGLIECEIGCPNAAES